MGRVPVQDGGRIKPLSTVASFMLLRHNGRRSFTADDEKVTSLEWILDCMLDPARAAEYRTFVIADSDVLDVIGLSDVKRRKRDRYSYNELRPGAEKLFGLAGEYDRIERKNQTLLQHQVVRLRNSYHEFTMLSRYLDFARAKVAVPPDGGLARMFAGATEVPVSAVHAKATELMGLFMTLHSGQLPEEVDAERAAKERSDIEQLLTRYGELTQASIGLAMFPPEVDLPPESPWLTPEEITDMALQQQHSVAGHEELLAAWEGLVAAHSAGSGVTGAAENVRARAAALAEARNEYDKIDLEVSFYKTDYFGKAALLFGASFLVIALSWLWSGSRILRRVGPIVLGLGTVSAIAGITIRCLVQSRPPVTNFYETIPFITVFCVVVAFVIEAIDRKRVALQAGALLGLAGMIWTVFYVGDSTDTMGRLPAVLDTNFWLWTHVTIVTAGYGAGFLAGVFGAAYIVARLFRFANADTPFLRDVARKTYGLICFGLLFSLVGTILGGIWANYSWGRFWGWDPKENGALMICLWQIAMLHGRMGGYLKNLGMAIASVGGAAVVMFSWKHVNMLGVGLHSYGATDGLLALWATYAGIGLVALLGWVVHLRDGRAVASTS